MTPQDQNRHLVNALENSRVSVFMLDRLFRYVWVVNPLFTIEPERMVGKTDAELYPTATAAQMEPLKHKVFLTGGRRKADIFLDLESGERRWFSLSIDPWRDGDGRIIGLAGSMMEITDQRHLDERLIVLMREVAHRSKNLLSVIQGLANQTAKTSKTINDFTTKFTGRLLSLGHAQDLLTATDWRGASMGELVKFQLSPYQEAYDRQIATRGRAMMLKSNAAQYLGLALHELVINAVKHGTLSEPKGQVSVAWRLMTLRAADAPLFVLVWSESGHNKPSEGWEGERGGFGRTMLTRIAPQALQGEAFMRFRPEGVIYRLTAPLTEVATNDWLYQLNQRSSKSSEEPVNASRH